MAVAGGAFPREGELAGSPLKVRIAEQQAEISVRLSKLADLHAKRLRLQAEQSDAVELTADGTISALAGDEAGTLIGEQQAILQSRADFQNVQAAAARAQAELAAGEADSLARQQDILRQQIESSAEVLANMENLLSRGLTNSERVRQIRSYYNEDKIELMLAASYEARANQNRVNLLTSVDQMERAQVREDAAALADVMAAIRGEEAAIAASRRMIRELAAVEAEEPDSGFLLPLEFRIRRSKPGGENILPAAMGHRCRAWRPCGVPPRWLWRSRKGLICGSAQLADATPQQVQYAPGVLRHGNRKHEILGFVECLFA